MKIALVGYGKMGKSIEQIALKRGHEIVLKISSSNASELHEDKLMSCDVVIEFTRPEYAIENIRKCVNAGKNIVCGTTGWLDDFEKIKPEIESSKIGFIQATNFSLGVNIFFALNEHLASMMKSFTEYQAEIHEIHHTAKLDAPSGTAISIANDMLKHLGQYNSWVNDQASDSDKLVIVSERKDPAPGTHKVTYTSPIDTIEISHVAHSREGFALGAVMAAEWLQYKQGIFTMKDVLSIH